MKGIRVVIIFLNTIIIIIIIILLVFFFFVFFVFFIFPYFMWFPKTSYLELGSLDTGDNMRIYKLIAIF